MSYRGISPEGGLLRGRLQPCGAAWARGLMALGLAFAVIFVAGPIVDGYARKAPQASAEESEVSVSFTDERLTVSAYNDSTSSVLREIAREAGVRIVVFGELENKMSVEFENLELDDGLRRLLGRYNLVLLYREVDDPQGKGRKARLMEAQVHIGSGAAIATMEFPAGRAQQSALLQRDGRNGAGEKSNEQKSRAKTTKLMAARPAEDEREVLARLKTAAFDADPSVRIDAVDELALLDDEKAALDILERVLREDTDAEVRANAISNIEDLEDVPVEPVLDAVLFDEAPEVRIGAMEIIGDQEWSDRRTVDTLSRVLDDPNEDIRLAALEVLGDLGERTVLEVAAQSNPHEEIRELATELLMILKQ